MDLSFGLIGIGKHGKKLANLLYQLDGVRLRAICHPDSKKTEHILEDLRPVSKPVEIVTSAKALCAIEQLDAVIVATPDGYHCSHGMDVLESGKHLYLEKPMATSLADAELLYNKSLGCEKQVIQLGYHLRYHPGFQTLQSILAKEIETLSKGATFRMKWGMAKVSAHPWRVSSGTWALDVLGTHAIDLCLWLFSPFELINWNVDHYSGFSGTPGERVAITLEFSESIRCQLDISVDEAIPFSFELSCTEMAIQGEQFTEQPHLRQLFLNKAPVTFPLKSNPWESSLADFCGKVRRGDYSRADLALGLKNVEVMTSASLS